MVQRPVSYTHLYTIRNGVGGDEKSHLVFEESSQGAISVTGVQGAVANSGGSMEIKSGSYKTVGCSVHGTKTAHYALYVAGENCDSKAIVTGGTFESVSYTHLDVYKRQDVEFCRIKRLFI